MANSTKQFMQNTAPEGRNKRHFNKLKCKALPIPPYPHTHTHTHTKCRSMAHSTKDFQFVHSTENKRYTVIYTCMTFLWP